MQGSMDTKDTWRMQIKIFALIGTFVLPFFCTIIPYKLSGYISKKGETGKRILSYLMCFGGGIFFGTYLLHMGPEVNTLMSESLHKLLNPNQTFVNENCKNGIPPRRIDYPLPELFIGFGFFLVLFSEKVVLYFNKRRLEKKKSCRKNGSIPCRDDVKSVPQVSYIGHISDDKACKSGEADKCKECSIGLPCQGEDEDTKGLLTKRTSDGIIKLLPVDIEDLNFGGPNSCRATNSCPFTGTGECCSDVTGSSNGTKPMLTQEKHIIVAMKIDDMKSCDDIERVSVGGGSTHKHGGGGHHHATRSIILILALSLHRIFEGMSIGLQDSTQNVVHLFIAVMCHETVIGFSLGLQFVKSSFPLRRLLLTSFLCSTIMPIGVAIGTVMTESGHVSQYIDIANGILQAIAMGTFIYVTFFEILQEEVDPEDTSLMKIVFIFAGFIMMALLSMIPEEQNIPNTMITLAAGAVTSAPSTGSLSDLTSPSVST